MHIDGLWLVTVMRSHLIFQFTFFVFFLDIWDSIIGREQFQKMCNENCTWYISFLTSALYALNTFNSINHEWLCVPYSKYILIPDLFFYVVITVIWCTGGEHLRLCGIIWHFWPTLPIFLPPAICIRINMFTFSQSVSVLKSLHIY